MVKVTDLKTRTSAEVNGALGRTTLQRAYAELVKQQKGQAKAAAKERTAEKTTPNEKE